VDFSNARYAELKTIFQGQRLPLAFVDLAAFDANVSTAAALAVQAGKKLRIGTKSIRCLGLMERVLAHPSRVFQGFLTYTAEETAWLASQGHDDFILAYPTVQTSDLALLAGLVRQGKRLSVMVDCPAHLHALDEAGRTQDVVLPACLEIDMAYRPLGGDTPHLGLWRSPIRTPQQALELVRQTHFLSHTIIDSLMGYEGHIAGTTDAAPGQILKNWFLRRLKNASVRELTRRRQRVVEALRSAGLNLRLVNGGGSGSIVSTLRDPSVSEGTIGSGLYAPGLFHYFREVRYLPSAFFALQVVRLPRPGIATCSGGGYIASGAIEKSKLPLPVMPVGMKYLDLEGAGEVQTPLALAPNCPPVQPGDPFFFQHAKAGELCERFNTLHLLQENKIIETILTYRGEGLNFL
jgi:D-serine deaminase-like pyridoxal phosphate-dependent protein